MRITPDFCWNMLIFARSDQILKRSWLISIRLGRTWRDLGRSQRDQARFRRDLARSQWSSKRSGQILIRSRWISMRSLRISIDQKKSYRQTTSISKESYFRCVFWSSRLKSIFHALNHQPTRRSQILGLEIRRRPSPASGRSVLKPDWLGWVGGSCTGSG